MVKKDFLHELIRVRDSSWREYEPEYIPFIIDFYNKLINQWNNIRPKGQIDITDKRKLKMFHNKERFAYKKWLICYLYKALNNNSIFFWMNVNY